MVGKSIPRLDAVDKVTGRGIYTTDMIPENALYLKVVRSTLPHAMIKRVDCTGAMKVEGVVGVYAASDIPGINESVALLPDRPLLANGRVKHVGQAIAVVAAEDLVTAEEAAELVEVEYEPLPAVFDPLDSLKPDAPRIHESGNIAKHMKLRKGNIEEGFRGADVIVEGWYKTPFQDPTPLEPESGLAIPNPDGTVTCIGSLQSPFHVQTGIAKILGLPPDKVRVIQAATGGAFGPKSDEMPVDTCGLSALVAVKTNRPAVLAYTREESMVAHTKRHPFYIRIKSGVKRDGRLTAWEAELFADTGAFASLGPLVIIRALFHATGPYVIPHVKSDSYCVYTNNTMCGSFRGFGGPQSAFASECHMDVIARKLGMDPVDLRLKNILRPGALTATSQVVDEACGLEECVVKATHEADWYRKRAEFQKDNGVMKRGIGIAIMYHGNSLGPEGNDYAAVHTKIEPNGIIVLRTGLTEYGTGAPSGLVQIASETLGVPVKYFRLEKPDTAYCQDTGPTVASRTITIGGRATILAAEQLRERLLKVAALKLGCDEKELGFHDGEVRSSKQPAKLIEYEDLVKEAYARNVDLAVVGHFMAPRCEFDPETSQGTTYLQYTYGAVVAEVTVDTEIGKLHVDRLVAAYDVGKTINPLALVGQIEGGTVQGLGYGTMEELVHVNGQVENPNLADYYIPTSMDIPEIKTIVIEYPGALGPYGAKAMGEPPIDLPAAAAANAVSHALGVGITEIPMTPHRILAALRRKAAN